MRPPSRYWQDLTTEDFRQLDRDSVIAIQPVAAIEQHGPHLPVWVDACICQGVVEGALDMLPDDLSVLVLPLLPVGVSTEHSDYPGTLSLSPETMIRALTEIGESVAAAGVRKLVLVNSHGGQPQILDLVAQSLRARRRMLVFRVNAYRDFRDPSVFPEDEIRLGIHAGAIETAIMLHLRADLVRNDKIADFMPAAAAQGAAATGPFGNTGHAWQAQDLHPSGACGDATLADAEKGKQLVARAAQALADRVQEIDGISADGLKDTP